jgi:hypothetical protein
MWHFKENVEENEDICMAAGGFIFLTSHILKEKTYLQVRSVLSK